MQHAGQENRLLLDRKSGLTAELDEMPADSDFEMTAGIRRQADRPDSESSQPGAGLEPRRVSQQRPECC